MARPEDDVLVYRAYFGDDITAEDLEFNAGMKIESMFVQIERDLLLGVLIKMGWVAPIEEGAHFQVVDEHEFRAWIRSGGASYLWEGRLTKAGRRRRRVVHGIGKEWETTGRLVTHLPPLIDVHPSHLQP